MKLTVPDHLELVRAGLSAGKTYRELARELGCHHTTVSIFARLHLPALRRVVEPIAVAHESDAMKILLIDIETRPNLGYFWRMWDENIGVEQLVEPVEMISFAAKWLGDPVVHFASSHHTGKRQMVEYAWRLLDRADAIMHYNGRRFDTRHLNREFLEAGMLPPSPFKQIDLMLTVKKQFSFPSYKLQYVAQALLDETKEEHEGFRLWLRCMEGDEDAWRRMRKYNIKDTVLLERLYEKLLPWIVGHPSYGAFTAKNVCPNCGSENLQHRGFEATKTGRYQRLHCVDCGKWSRNTHREDHTEVTEVTG